MNFLFFFRFFNFNIRGVLWVILMVDLILKVGYYQYEIKITQHSDEYLWSTYRGTKEKHDQFEKIIPERIEIADFVICTNWFSEE